MILFVLSNFVYVDLWHPVTGVTFLSSTSISIVQLIFCPWPRYLQPSWVEVLCIAELNSGRMILWVSNLLWPSHEELDSGKIILWVSISLLEVLLFMSIGSIICSNLICKVLNYILLNMFLHTSHLNSCFTILCNFLNFKFSNIFPLQNISYVFSAFVFSCLNSRYLNIFLQCKHLCSYFYSFLYYFTNTTFNIFYLYM